MHETITTHAQSALTGMSLKTGHATAETSTPSDTLSIRPLGDGGTASMLVSSAPMRRNLRSMKNSKRSCFPDVIHLYAGQKTGCCSTPILDLPKEDTLTFRTIRVTCGTNPLRHPEPLARWLHSALGEDSRHWSDLSPGERDSRVGVARQVLGILGFDER